MRNPDDQGRGRAGVFGLFSGALRHRGCPVSLDSS